jgi:hypothetical protein
MAPPSRAWPGNGAGLERFATFRRVGRRKVENRGRGGGGEAAPPRVYAQCGISGWNISSGPPGAAVAISTVSAWK